MPPKKTKPEPSSGALALSEDAALAELAEDFDVTGLEEADQSDIQLPSLTLNFKGTDPNGDPVPMNAWFNTVTEESKKKRRLQLLHLHKSREWREYIEGEGSVTRCRSFDAVTGTMDDGTKRPCEGCPDYRWVTVQGKRTRRCGDVWNVGVVDLDEGAPAVIRFRKTGLAPIKSYLNRHHLRRRKTKAGAMGDWPLYFFEVEASAKVSENGNYAVPVLEKTGVLSKEQIRLGHQTAKFLKERAQEIAAHVSDLDTEDDSPDASPSVDASSFLDPSPENSASPGRF